MGYQSVGIFSLILVQVFLELLLIMVIFVFEVLTGRQDRSIVVLRGVAAAVAAKVGVRLSLILDYLVEAISTVLDFPKF